MPSIVCCDWPRSSAQTSPSPGSRSPAARPTAAGHATRYPRCPPPQADPQPRSSWETKRWPPEHFAAIARRAVRGTGRGLVAVGAAEDCPLVEESAGRLDPIPVLDLCGRTTLPQLAALAAESDLVLSNDTGPLHLATRRRQPGGRALHLHESPAQRALWTLTRPRSRASIWCAGSYLKTCDRLDCMRRAHPGSRLAPGLEPARRKSSDEEGQARPFRPSRTPCRRGVERESGDPFEDRDRRLVGADETVAADDEGLLQGVLAADARVAGGVGEDDPRRVGGNSQRSLGHSSWKWCSLSGSGGTGA